MEIKYLLFSVLAMLFVLGVTVHRTEKPYYRTSLNEYDGNYIQCLVFKTGSVICSHKDSIIYEGNYKQMKGIK